MYVRNTENYMVNNEIILFKHNELDTKLNYTFNISFYNLNKNKWKNNQDNLFFPYPYHTYNALNWEHIDKLLSSIKCRNKNNQTV